ncbi:molecular chaperone DnaJ [Wolbachia endosymbiont of Folsomia candida]|uniref:molecular chaperone DnaJ n=1 Tax=Wolbachia endosymbiont of Folsomia candida TaxID=169402 RepID=UPI000A6A0B70|nr:molecular chaperone DnaJ [Wolbachia endosymbiont of Folsomia candida]APR99140.2 molecular chaperone DnaJ [Wolbachia endosymbiont of Folsomia candida]
MSDQAALTEQDYKDNEDLFKILEIKIGDVVGENYQELVEFFKKQHRKLILVTHPDKGGDKYRFDKIFKAHKDLQEYIKPLGLGNPCISSMKRNDPKPKSDVCEEDSSCLTFEEFHYRKKLFDKLKISREEAVGKNFQELISILKKKESAYAEDLEFWNRIHRYLYEVNIPFSIQLFRYISPLKKNQNLIECDKRKLALKFIVCRNIMLIKIQDMGNFPLALSGIVMIGCYLSWWVIVFAIIFEVATFKLEGYYKVKYQKSEISTDEFVNKMNYIRLAVNLFYCYPFAALSIYLLATNFVTSNSIISSVVFGVTLSFAILAKVLAPVFSKCCEIYAEKHTRNLLEEDPKDRVQKETDLLKLKWYDPRLLLIPIIMPLVRKYFSKIADELAERNLDEVNTNMSDVKPEQPEARQGAAEFV